MSLTIISSVGKSGSSEANLNKKESESIIEESVDKESSVSEGELPEPFVDTDDIEEETEEETEEEESVAEQQDLLPEKKSARGRFDKAEPSVTDDGEDLDVPSFLRKKKK